MTTPNKSGISRRTLTTGAAWAVPAVAVASAAPAYALSPGTVTLTQTSACKSPGSSCKTFEKGYIFTFAATNTWTCPVNITGATFVLTSGATPGTLTLATPILVPTGSSPALTIQVNSTSSANVVFTGTFTFTYEGSCTEGSKTDTFNVSVTGTPPDCDCPSA